MEELKKKLQTSLSPQSGKSGNSCFHFLITYAKYFPFYKMWKGVKNSYQNLWVFYFHVYKIFFPPYKTFFFQSFYNVMKKFQRPTRWNQSTFVFAEHFFSLPVISVQSCCGPPGMIQWNERAHSYGLIDLEVENEIY